MDVDVCGLVVWMYVLRSYVKVPAWCIILMHGPCTRQDVTGPRYLVDDAGKVRGGLGFALSFHLDTQHSYRQCDVY
jgi:hypothetical protein